MTPELIISALLGLIGGGGLVQFLINRHDKQQENEVLKKLEENRQESQIQIKGLEKNIVDLQLAVRESELDRTRSQLLIVMYHNPKNIDTILKIGEKYFNQLGGNWYMDAEFQKWMDENNVTPPSWFVKNNK